MKAILVARVSTEEQKEAGNSLPAQKHRLESYCARNGLERLKLFSFDESAFKNKRDDFDEVVEFIKAQKEVVAVLFDKVDRFSRNVFDKRVAYLYELAVEGKIELHFVSDSLVIDQRISSTQKFQFSMSLGLAKYYSDAISDNVKRAQEQKVRRGEFPSAAPFGYQNIELEGGKKWIVPHEFNSIAVKRIFQWYASGSFALSEIVLKLKEDFRINKPKSMVHKILNDKFYVGVMTWNDQDHKHGYEKLIDQSLFDKVQAIMHRRKDPNKRFKYAGKPAAYRGLLRCHECGCSITPDEKKRKLISGGHTTHSYYHCTNYHKKHTKVLNVKESIIDEQLAELFRSLEMPADKLEMVVTALKESHQSKNDFFDSQIKHFNTQLETYEKRRRNVYLDYLDRRITVKEYEEIKRNAESEIEKIQEKVSRLNYAEKEYYLTTAHLVELASRASDIFLRSKPTEKRQLINLVLSNATLDEDKLRYTVQFPFNLVLKYAPSSAWLPRVDSNHEP